MSEPLYFDCNTTFGPKPKKPPEAPWTLQHLIDDLDQAGIAGALVFYTPCLHYDPMLGNRRLLRELDGHRDRLFPCWVALPPASGEFPDVPAFMAELEAHDVRAVRIDPPEFGIPPTEKRWGQLRDALRSSGTLVVVPAPYSARDLSEVDRILTVFDACNTLLIGHGWAQWRQIVYLLDDHPNLHIEFSAFQANRAIEYFAARYGPTRCLFGTGLIDKAPGAARGFLDWTLLPEDQAALVAGGNLRRLLRNAGPDRIPEPTRWHDALTAAARAGKPLPCRVLDAHCHILHDGAHAAGGPFVFHRGDADGMVELTRRTGIDKTAIMSWAGPLSMDADLGNEIVAAAVRKYPDDFIGLATVNPEYQTPAEIDAVIRTYHLELGFPGLKTYAPNQTLWYDDSAFEPWFRFGDEHRLYAVIDPAGKKPDEAIEALARKYPNLGLHLDHCGQSWDYAKWAAALAEEHPNIWAQLNYTAVTNGVIEYLAARLGAGRLLFGTDAPMRDPRPQAGWLAFTRLPESDKRKIFGENFETILRNTRLPHKPI